MAQAEQPTETQAPPPRRGTPPPGRGGGGSSRTSRTETRASAPTAGMSQRSRVVVPEPFQGIIAQRSRSVPVSGPFTGILADAIVLCLFRDRSSGSLRKAIARCLFRDVVPQEPRIHLFLPLAICHFIIISRRLVHRFG